ncbi:MAG TPA: hypothetical protein VNQ73_15445 [Ilumatobacter sp.]|nr:hypothetical protein [Ilumatobacter sp.]
MTDTAAGTETIYVIPAERVKQSVGKLLSRDTHPFFIAYLWLWRRSVIQGITSGIDPEWAELGPYMEVPGGPLPGKPYLRPFWKGARNSQQEWLNPNLAGSFAPSSFRGDHIQPVVTTDASGGYVLQPNHWDRALEHFLYGQQLPALALGAYLLRNRGFIAESPPTNLDIIAAFRQEFRYGDAAQLQFDTLYETEWKPAGATYWFEPLEGDA